MLPYTLYVTGIFSLQARLSKIRNFPNETGDSEKMIHELQRPDKSILNLDIQFPEIQAIIEGNNPGWVFVDDLMSPTAALVWAQGIQGFYLIGDSDSKIFLEELNTFTDRELSRG